MSTIKLDLGSGRAPREGYRSVDLFFEADIKDDIITLGTIGDGVVDEVYCSHALEHLAVKDVFTAIKNWHRVLSVGGTVHIVVPDFPEIIQAWLDAYRSGDLSFDLHTRRPSLAWIFGNQEHEGEFHKSAFDEAVLRWLLERAGFHDVGIKKITSHYQPSIEAKGTKL